MIKKIKKIHKKFKGKLSLKSGLFFLLIGGAMTAFAAYLVFSQITFKKDFEKFLPNEDLIAFINIKETKLPRPLQEKNPNLQKNLENTFSYLLGVDYQKIKTWHEDEIGLALYTSENAKNEEEFSLQNEENFDLTSDNYFVILLAIKNKKAASDHMDSLLLEGEEYAIKEIDGGKIFSLPSRNIKCAFIEGYLACTKEKADFFEKYTQAKNGEILTLSQNSNYERGSAQVHRNFLMNVFINFENAKNLANSNFIKPLLENLTTMNLVLAESEKSLKISSFFIKKNPDQEPENKNSNTNENSLANLIPLKTIFFSQGKNTKASLDNLLSNLKVMDEDADFFVMARARAIVKDLFSEEISLEKDILPLFQGEYVIGIAEEGDNLMPFLIVESDDVNFAEAKRKKLAEGFAKMIGEMEPEVLKPIMEGGDEGADIIEVFPGGSDVEIFEEEISNGVLTYIYRKKASETIIEESEETEDLAEEETDTAAAEEESIETEEAVSEEEVLDQSTENQNEFAQTNLSEEIALARKDNILVISSDMNVAKSIIQNMSLPKDRQEVSPLLTDFPLKTFSSSDETFAFYTKSFQLLPVWMQYENNKSWIETFTKVSGKIVRLPDSFRIEMQLNY